MNDTIRELELSKIMFFHTANYLVLSLSSSAAVGELHSSLAFFFFSLLSFFAALSAFRASFSSLLRFFFSRFCVCSQSFVMKARAITIPATKVILDHNWVSACLQPHPYLQHSRIFFIFASVTSVVPTLSLYPYAMRVSSSWNEGQFSKPPISKTADRLSINFSFHSPGAPQAVFAACCKAVMLCPPKLLSSTQSESLSSALT
mmetsp:Transcript_13344/g.29676  ORF Transcript_13344/g.29676 Transcript_13344/m.29676 type:complete len:203 (+) Transcript_13344:3-611(+)